MPPGVFRTSHKWGQIFAITYIFWGRAVTYEPKFYVWNMMYCLSRNLSNCSEDCNLNIIIKSKQSFFSYITGCITKYTLCTSHSTSKIFPYFIPAAWNGYNNSYAALPPATRNLCNQRRRQHKIIVTYGHNSMGHLQSRPNPSSCRHLRRRGKEYQSPRRNIFITCRNPYWFHGKK